MTLNVNMVLQDLMTLNMNMVLQVTEPHDFEHEHGVTGNRTS